ncbi:hypothetical protein [Dyadobacter sp. SG02]|uniref:hypothetical protein n=1 Tax=Dyadobacter sp. SG02 TaxID=1855291 RepID=UPI001E2CA741|nr:hypothetical protein [Dyadobacter sp. SG02]
MEKHKQMVYETRLEELLKDKEKVIAIIKNSPYLNRKHEEAAEHLSKIKPPFPWDRDKPGETI